MQLPPSHPSSLTLERHLTGEAIGWERTALADHLAACPSCQERIKLLEASRERFSTSAVAFAARNGTVRADRAWRRRAALIGSVSAVSVAALVTFVVVRLPSEPPGLARGTSAKPSPLRQGRTPVELRPDLTAARLRTIALRGKQVPFGQGSFEGAEGDGPSRPFVLEHTSVEAEIHGFVSSVTVTQRFKNPFSQPVEAIYVFPLPDDSAVDEMTLTAGTRTIRAQIKKREDARRVYEEAKAAGKRAALLDQERPNIFTQSVANLLPGETVTVSLRYVAPLRFDDGIYTFNFPMVVGPRYVPGKALAGASQGSGTAPDTTEVVDASRITPLIDRTGHDISVRVKLEAGTAIEELWSASHRLVSDRLSSSQAIVTLDPSDRIPNKDLILRWKVTGSDKRAALLSSGGPGGTFALMLNPEAQPDEAAVMPKEMVFLIDTSCSMNGRPLEAAKGAMKLAMQQMNPDDTFMLIDFADRASAFHDAPLPNLPKNVDRAVSYLDALPASGGTNQLDGLRRALDRPADPHRLRVVLLMTDGFIGNERQIFGEVEKMLRGSRVFGFGIGTSVNHYLLSRLSESGRGSYQYLRPDEDPSGPIDRFVRRIRKPLMTEIALEWEGVEVHSVLPQRVPDLFDAQPVIVLGRYRMPGRGKVTLKGMMNGAMRELTVPIEFPDKPTGHGLSTLWARARIEQIDRLQHFGEFSEAVREITTLGLEHHLVTAYTSFVAVDDTVVAGSTSTQVVVPNAEPELTTIDVSGLVGHSNGAAPPGSPAFEQSHGTSSSSPGGGDGFDDLMDDSRKGKSGRVFERQTARTGALGADVVGKIVADNMKSLNRCLEEQLRVNPAINGQLMLTLVVGKSGTATSVRDLPGEFRNSAFARCADKAVRRWVFPASNDETEVSIPLKIGHGPYVPPDPGVVDEVRGELSMSDITEAVISHRAELAACAEKQRKAQPGISGKLVVEWTVLPNGKPTKVKGVTPEFEGTVIARCVTAAIRTWTFPRHSSPSASPFRFPFKF